jgi:hypothetical protein
MEALEKAIAMISAASGADATAVAERLESDATAEAIATEFFEPKYKAQRDQGHKIATDKTRKAVETALKAAGVEDASFDALPAAIETLQSKAAAANPAALTPEQLLKQKPVVDALNAERLKTDTAVADAEKRVRGELETERQQFQQQRTSAAVRAAAEAEIARLNPNFTAGKEAVQKERLIRELLSEGKFQLAENGEIQLVDEDGNVLPGKLGNGVAKFADLVRERAEDVYGLPVSSPRESAGLTPEQIAAGQGATVFKEFKGAAPKTAEEYQELANDPNLSTPALQELQSYWREKQAA